MMPDRTVVLNLKRRPDRLTAFYRRGLPADWPYPPPRTMEALDGYRLVMPMPPSPTWTAGPGAYGCALTHRAALCSAVHDGIGTLFVLEDDAIFTPGFAEAVTAFTAALPDDAGMVMLGGQHMAPPAPVAPGVVRCVDTHRTHAYMITRAAMPAVMDVWAWTTDHLDHRARAVQALVPTYAPVPFLVGQAADYSDITGQFTTANYWDGEGSTRDRGSGNDGDR